MVSSFGKTYHVTGWKVGHVHGPAALMAEFRKVHQFNVFTVATPPQLALADYMSDPLRHLQLPDFYQSKRDQFVSLMQASRFELLPSAGIVLPACQLPAHFGLARYRIRPLPHPGGGRGRDSGIGLLRRRARRPGDPLLLRQER